MRHLRSRTIVDNLATARHGDPECGGPNPAEMVFLRNRDARRLRCPPGPRYPIIALAIAFDLRFPASATHFYCGAFARAASRPTPLRLVPWQFKHCLPQRPIFISTEL